MTAAKHRINLLLGPTLALLAATAAQAEGVGYDTVEHAFAAVNARPGVQTHVTEPDGWVIIQDAATNQFWAFTPAQHYAHPAVFKRELKMGAGGLVNVETTTLCQASKAACDLIVEEFGAMTSKIPGRQN